MAGCCKQLLHVNARDVLSAGDDDVLGTILDLNRAVRMPNRKIAREEPVSDQRLHRWADGEEARAAIGGYLAKLSVWPSKTPLTRRLTGTAAVAHAFGTRRRITAASSVDCRIQQAGSGLGIPQ
jgi:hypothetical protein